MQTKLSILALSLAMGTGFAQAEVTISGDLTAGVKLDDRGSDDKDGIYIDGTVGIYGKNQIESINSNLIWAASAGVNSSKGGSEINDWLTVKDAYVGLAGEYGTGRIGRMQMPSYEAQDTLFTDTGLTWLAGDYGLGQGVRVNNMIRYDSPTMAGFNIGAAYAFKDYDHEGSGSGTTYDIAAKYKLAGLQLDATYQKRNSVNVDNDDMYGSPVTTGNFDGETYYAGARYEFQNGFGVTGGYKNNTYSPELGDEREQGEWLAQVSYKQDKHAVYVSYANLDDVKLNGDTLGDSGAQALAVRYNYSLNKNNIAFVEGRYVKNEENSSIGAGDNAFEYSGKAGEDTSRVMVGMKTFF
jgi:predicted porin